MDPTSSYVFRGNASGVSFRVRRPVDLVLPVQAQSSLPATGGVSESRVGPVSFGPRPVPTNPPVRGLSSKATAYVTFDSAATTAHGDFLDTEKAVAATRGMAAYGDVPARTTVTSEVTNLSVIDRLKVGLIVMKMQSESKAIGEPCIRVDGSKLENVSVDGYPVEITLNTAFFCDCDTMVKLQAAAATGDNHQYFFDAGPTAPYGFNNSTLSVKCTLVKEMKWAGDSHPDAVINGNAIHIPNFGVVYFGEMFVSHASRRLTMVRFHLGHDNPGVLRRGDSGGDDGGDGSAGSGDTNGTTWPPTAP
jgi:hypothetical protein